jgi:hypothetical protein
VKDLDISEVAQRSGVPASTLRFYEEKGLTAATGRRGLRRLFDPREGLRHAVACTAPSYMECPTFRRLLRAAADGAIRVRGKKAAAPQRLRR